MSALFAGIDGGQSATQAIIGDECGQILGRGEAGPCDEIGERVESTRLAGALQSALRDACRAGGLPATARFDTIVAGVSGYEGRVYGAPPQLPSSHTLLVHDALAAHAGALGGAAGVIVIAGTGSVVYGRNDEGAEITLGGWGYLFGDEGSAFWIAREALAALMQARDAGDSSLNEEERIAEEFFGTKPVRAIGRAFYAGEISRQRLAAFAPTAMRSPRYASIVRRGANYLAALSCRALDALGVDCIALCGGLVQERSYYDAIAAAVAQKRKTAHIVPRAYEPVAGALLLAYRHAGRPITELRA